jgi:hypothetical protein
MMDGMAGKRNAAADEAGMAVLAAVRGLLEDTKPAQEAQQAGDDLTGALVAIGAAGRAMQRDWSPLAQYQAIALLAVTVQVLSKLTGKGEEEILADLESNYH